jgi:hypothetical protein
MAGDAVNALIPVAAVVHIALGIMALILVRRSVDKGWNERFAGYIISWMMLILGMEYIFKTIIDLKLASFSDAQLLQGAYTDLLDSGYTYAEKSMNTVFVCLVFILPLVYPYPILQKDNVLKICTAIVIILGIILVPLDIFTEFSYRDPKLALLWVCYLVWIPVYLRFLFGELLYGEEKSREVSSVTVLLLLGIFGPNWIFWLQSVTGLSKGYFQRWLVEDEVILGMVAQTSIGTTVQVIGMTLSGVSFLVILFGELWRAYSKEISGLTVAVGLVFIVGVMWFLITIVVSETAESCVESVCEAWDPTFIDWYAFTYQVTLFLGVPLVFMFIVLNYNIVETTTDYSKLITRIMVLLLLLVATSSLIEMIQIILPIPEMVTSALFAGGVVLFIGWEEKIMNRMITEKSNVIKSIRIIMPMNDINLGNRQYKTFSIAIFCLIIYSILLSILFDSIGINT